MNDIEIIAQFRHLIAECIENDKRLALAAMNVIVNGDFKEMPVFESAFINMRKVVIEIKEKLAQYNVLQVDDLALRNDLIAIRENKDFACFGILEILNKYADEGHKLNFLPEINHDKWSNILQEQIIPEVDPETLIRRKMDLGALLVGKTVPKHLRGHLEMIKECYTWGFGNAASIYCRVILEEGFREALKSKPEFRTPQGKKDLKTWLLDWLLNHSRKNKYFYKEAIEKAYKIKNNVNRILHPSGGKESDDVLSNTEIIKYTFYVMEMLFR